jgi:Zn finger protein HypA/HybF involved in hydrogenase expression
MIISKIKSIDKEDLQNISDNSNSYTEILVKLGYSPNSGGAYRELKIKMEQENIIFTSKGSFRNKGENGKYIKTSIKDALVEGSKFSRTHLKIRIIKEGLLENKCCLCGIDPVWNDKVLTLQLDHINGIHNDNRIENLRIICPNCHSQTKTFGRKNKP